MVLLYVGLIKLRAINVPYDFSKMKGGVNGFDLGLFFNGVMKLFDTS